MSLETLLQDQRRKNIIFPRPSLVAEPKRAKKVFNLSVNKGISTEEADIEVLTGEVIAWADNLTDSPLYEGAAQVFDPAEPPMGGEAPTDPMGELLRAELAVAGKAAGFGLKTLGFIFSPIERAFKFITNAAMMEPLTKTAVGPLKAAALNEAMGAEINRQVNARVAKAEAKGELLDPDEKGAFIDQARADVTAQVREDAAKSIRAINSETEDVEIADFMQSAKDALKALVPWPGFADDVKTFGDISADSYERIVGTEAPFWYAPLADVTNETVAMVGLFKLANAAQFTKDAEFIRKGAKITKAEMRAIKKLHKQASRVKKAKVVSNTVPDATDGATATQKLISLLKEAKPLRDKKALELHKSRQLRFAKLSKVQKNVRGSKLVRATKQALKGKAPVPDFEPIGTSLTPQEINTLFNLVNNSQLGIGFDKGRGILSLDKLLRGQLITKSEIANLEAVFGRALGKTLFRKQSISSMMQDLSFDVINLPRAVLASYDLSAGLRQGIIFSVSHPVASMKSFGRSVRAAASLQYSDDIERITRSTKMGKLAERFGVHISPTGFSSRLSSKEENYMSSLADFIPGVPASERAFTTFLNQQRREVFAIQAEKWIRRGITPANDPKSYQQFAKFVNHATGRGSFENLKPGALTALNATFFSPRFQVSRVQVIGDLISPATTANARKVIARDLAEFYVTGMSFMAMAKAGGAEVEMNPRSSDYGKIKVGNTRYNYWGAFQPLATFTARMITGEVKSTATGKVKPRKRVSISDPFGSTVVSFLRTKLAPVPGAVVDVFAQQTVPGDPVEATPEFFAKKGFETLVPLFAQDVIDAWRFQGADAQLPISTGLAFTGLGVQTWEVAPFAQLELAKDSLARQTYGKDYSELGFMETRFLDHDILINHPGLVELEQQSKFESNNVTFLTKQAKEQRKSERFIEKRVNKELLADLNEMHIALGGVDRVFGNWRLNDEQYKEYQEKVAENINVMFEELRPLWDTQEIGSATKIETASRILRIAKQRAANEMKIGSME